MKAQITYINNHTKSIIQAEESYRSFKTYGWDVELISGLTPKTLKTHPPVIEGSRLLEFKKTNENRYLTKLSCAMNHIKFWNTVVEANETMAFIEHDAICLGFPQEWEFEDYLILNAEYVFRPPNKLGVTAFRHFSFPEKKGVNSLPEDYPLPYRHENKWKGKFMAPGTGAYAITPAGAKKMLEATKNVIDQSDFMLNEYNLKIEYVYPSPVKFNTENLSTSYGV